MKWEWDDMSWGELLEELNSLSVQRHQKMNGRIVVELDHKKRINIWCGKTPDKEKVDELRGFLQDLTTIVKEEILQTTL